MNFYRVLNDQGAVVAVASGNNAPLTEETALDYARKYAAGQPGRKFYVSRAIQEVVVDLPPARITNLLSQREEA